MSISLALPVVILVVLAVFILAAPASWTIWLERMAMGVLVVFLALLAGGQWRLPDALATWFYLVVAVISLFALWFSEPYIRRESDHWHWNGVQGKQYGSLLLIFIASLVAVAIWTNFLWLWLAIEAATLSSVFLVGTPRDRGAIEAAWKYLLVTEAGGLAALVGTAVALTATGDPVSHWNYASWVYGQHVGNARWILIGAYMAMIGYATKAGLAPFHTWLPDAHSEAPAPVSALLSGLKLAGAVVIVYHLFGVLTPTVPAQNLKDGLVILGLLSLLVAAAFVAFQTDLKRLWAYSSIEHIGLISLGMGFGGIALVGAVFHIWTHASSKTLLFQNAGTVRLLYHTSKSTQGAKALLARTPWTGGMLALGSAAIVGLPPFAPFWSEWLILVGGFQAASNRIPDIIAVGLLVVIFSGIALRIPNWLWVPGSHDRQEKIREPWGLMAPNLFLALLVLAGGIGVPILVHPLWHHLTRELLKSPI
ncbi:MAG: nitroreductase family protein [Sulfobacillus benefaciens]|uniref:Nitroreductase family protein n=1 Tax=Sulfobacillus benefaciens TaxID=453960 RepID=A0A2T2XGD3_9FIRM|nr:MAG: nitroreductase family protein [Sulfobacillus benefaciens]